MWVQLDDALLSGTVALRLAFILEKRSRKKDAVIVLEQGISTLNRARGQLLVKDISASEHWTEMFALSSVSTNSVNTAVPRRTNEELEQALACLQVDLLHARVRVVLQQGVDDARRAAATIEAKHARQRLQRTKDQALFGTKSRKMLREENEQAVLDQQRPVLPARAVERRLIAACNRNLYEKAIVLVEIARLPRVRPEREALLAQAAAALEQAEEAESLVAKQVQEPPITAHLAVPPPPRLVMRGATEMVLMADAWRPPKPAPGAKPQEEAVGLALFCKEEGAGVAVSLNNVLFRGSGVPRPVGEKIVVTGLQPNESYVFALAAFDRHGHVVYLERTGAIPTKDLLGEFDEETFLKHLTFSREALRAYTTANCAERKKRLYKAIAVLDLKGFRMEHLKLMDLIKKANAVFAWHYPESIFKFVVINAPFIFSSAWKMAKAFVHPITAAKVHIIGSSEKEVRRTFDELGITLREGISLDALQTAKLDGWAAELAAARAGPHAKTLEGGYAPDVDLERMKGVNP